MKTQLVFEVLPEEKQAVWKYAQEHPKFRHRELNWRMLDEDIAALSSSSVYRILQGNRTGCIASEDERTFTGTNSRRRVAPTRPGGPVCCACEWVVTAAKNGACNCVKQPFFLNTHQGTNCPDDPFVPLPTETNHDVFHTPN